MLRGSAARVMEMGAAASEKLFSCVSQGHIQGFRDVAGALQLAPAPVRGRAAQVPVRVLACQRAGLPGSWAGVRYTSRPAPVTYTKSVLRGDSLDGSDVEEAKPASPHAAAPGTSSASAEEEAPAMELSSQSAEAAPVIEISPATETVPASLESILVPMLGELSGDLGAACGAQALEGARVTIHGIEPPLSTDVGALFASFAAGDGFLYIVVHLP